MSTDRDQLAAALVFECELTASATEARAAVDKLWPVVDRIANERAAAELEAAANAIEGDGQGGFEVALRRINAVDHLRSTAAALRASSGEGATT